MKLEIYIEAARVKNDLNSRTLPPGTRFRQLFTAIEHRFSYKRLAVWRIFDQLEFQEIRMRAVGKPDRILVEYRTERILPGVSNYP